MKSTSVNNVNIKILLVTICILLSFKSELAGQMCASLSGLLIGLWHKVRVKVERDSLPVSFFAVGLSLFSIVIGCAGWWSVATIRWLAEIVGCDWGPRILSPIIIFYASLGVTILAKTVATKIYLAFKK